MLARLANFSVFTCLWVNTIVSSLIVAVIAIVCLQRVADEHPRRYLSKALFTHIAQTLTAEQLRDQDLDGSRFEVYPLDALPVESDLPLVGLLEAIEADPDGVATSFHDDHYLAATIYDGNLILLPRYGRPLSEQARILVFITIATIVLVTVINYFTIRYLISPFSVLDGVTKNVDDNNLSFRVPLERTYGEFRNLGHSFNGMLQRLDHVNTARKHMLLAIPHELRSPLARLKVRKDLIVDDDLRADVAGDIKVLEELLDVILESERLQTNEDKVVRKTFRIEPLLNKLLRSFGERRREIDLHIETTRTAFHADEFLMRLLITNLVTNALRYGRNKRIVITVAEGERDPSSLLLTVADQGIGIPEDQISFMTEPFWRHDESRQRASGGYGLGLYLCKRIVKSHGGLLQIASTVGTGTTVSVRLPDALRFSPLSVAS